MKLIRSACFLFIVVQINFVAVAWSDVSPFKLEIVPIITNQDTFIPESWMQGFPKYAQQFWQKTSQGKLRLDVQLGQPIAWQRCQKCQLSPKDLETLLPWVMQLAARLKKHDVGFEQQISEPRAFLLLVEHSGVEGAGFFIPEHLLAAQFGVTGFHLLVADRPQSALHEIGHWLELPDRYSPHQPATQKSVLTLMGWMNDPAAPLDPVLRWQKNWIAQRAVASTILPVHKTLYPDETLVIEDTNNKIWFGLQPLPSKDWNLGWLLEIDATDRQDLEFTRLETFLLAHDQPDLADIMVTYQGKVWHIGWQFIPTPPHVIIDIEDKTPPQAGGCGLN